MVLDNVLGRTDAVVVAGAGTNTDVLRHRDLHVVDVVGVPQRLVQFVGEPEAQKVLNRFLTQVMINAEDIFGRKYLGHQIVKLLGRLEVVTKGLLDNDPPPSLQMLRQPSFAKLCQHRREQVRRNRQIERVVAARSLLLIELVQLVAKILERLSLVVLTHDYGQRAHELVENALIELCLCEGTDRLLDHLLQRDLEPPRHAGNGEGGWQETVGGKVVERWQDLAVREVAGNAEEHEATGPRDLRQPAILRMS